MRRLIFALMLGILLLGMVVTGITSLWHTSVVRAATGTKIVISIPLRRLYLYRHNKLFQVYPVAVGKPNTPSPRGEFYITQKAIWGDGFGTRWMRISTPWGIYGIHGTNKPWSVGTVASHGCFRMLNRDVEQLYALVSVHTPVIVEGITPYTRIQRALALNSIGEDVVELQRELRTAKLYSGPLSGLYTPEVKQSIEQLQSLLGLPITGVATLATENKLLRYIHAENDKPGYLNRANAGA